MRYLNQKAYEKYENRFSQGLLEFDGRPSYMERGFYDPYKNRFLVLKDHSKEVIIFGFKCEYEDYYNAEVA